jgi:hypothetical protein
MITAVFRHVEPIFILLYAKGEFGEIVIVDPVTTDILFFGDFTYMPEHFRQPVSEHDCLFWEDHQAINITRL